jgi:hypothetical protein
MVDAPVLTRPLHDLTGTVRIDYSMSRQHRRRRLDRSKVYQ